MTGERPNVTDPGRIIAHRGASQVAPENTLAAFREADRQGVWWIEFDVSLLGDGTPVVHHDGSLDRCTTGTGPLALVGAEKLGTLDAGSWHGPAFRGEPLPTLEQVLDLLEERTMWANLELKPHDDPTGALANHVATALKSRPWAAERIITSSFALPELQAFRDLMPDAPLAVLYDDPPPDWRARLTELNAAALHLKYLYLRQSLIVEAVSHGFDIRVFTINEPQLMTQFREFGLTGLITDHPPAFLELSDWQGWSKT